MNTNENDTQDEREALDALIDRYLDGLLSPEETSRFERMLLRPEVGEAFGEALLLRQLLQDMPPDQAPEELMSRLESALGIDATTIRKRAQRMPRLRAALGGMSWMVRGPAQAMTVPATLGAAEAASGFSNARYALGPMGTQAHATPPTRPSWWRRALGLSRRRP